MKFKTWLCAMVPLVAVASCGGQPTASAPGPDAQDGPSAASPIAVNDAAVYTAMLRHYLQEAAKRGSTAPVLYALDRADPEAGDPMATGGKSSPIPQSVQRAVTRRLADLARVTWVASSGDVVNHQSRCPQVRLHRSVVTLDVVPPSGEHMKLGIGVYSGCLDGEWQTYVLGHGADRWRVTGTAGPISMS